MFSRSICALGSALLVGGSAVCATPAASEPIMADKETAILFECIRRVTTPLLDARVSPERFKMAMDGACLAEERDALSAAEAHLSTMDGGYRHITEKTMAEVRQTLREVRAEIVSGYVVDYETMSRKGTP